MRLVLDYGGVLVPHRDEREFAHLLGIDPTTEPYPGWLAYYCFRAGLVDTEADYLDLLSTLTGATEEACRAYVARTWLDPEFPATNRETLARLAETHSLVLLSNMAKPWVEQVLERYEARSLFDSVLVSSELGRPKPHPRVYLEAMADVEGEVVMVSDEYDEDLLMAQALGMTTVWVRNDDETPFRRPDHVVESFEDLPQLLEGR